MTAARRIVVKVGTSTVTHPDGRPHYGRLEGLVRGISDAWSEGRQVLLVSSGAIGMGVGRMGLAERPEDLTDKQALAAVGQALLMRLYERLFNDCDRVVAQVLLTRQDIEDEERREHARRTLLRLLDWHVVPVINENDTVAVEEINFGDNDNLSALVARLVEADLLVILTDTEGLYDGDPRVDPEARRIAIVPEITAEIEELAGGTGSSLARGGMVSKVMAARLAAEAGIPTVVASGARRGVIQEILAGEDVGTLFVAESYTRAG